MITVCTCAVELFSPDGGKKARSLSADAFGTMWIVFITSRAILFGN
jgi:hypothetical protein